MTSFDRSLQKMKKEFAPAGPTAADRILLARLAAGTLYFAGYRADHNLGAADDDGSQPAQKLHTSQGTRLLIDILHEGRERNYQRQLRDHQPTVSTAPLANGGE
jgi:hypothetical protein